MMKAVFRLITHGLTLLIGFALGLYTLPILTQPPAPAQDVQQSSAENARFSGRFSRDQKGSDFLHWGEGAIRVTDTQIVHDGKLAPGPDYRLYLIPEHAENEAEFQAIKGASAMIGQVDSFNGFALDIPAGIATDDYVGVLIWCEAFEEFITSAIYRQP